MTDDHEAALLDAVLSDPGDLQARTVYADWLEERGDPRGEYLRLDTQLGTLPARLKELAARIDPGWMRAVNGPFRISIVSFGENKITAIKLVREVTGLGLRDAKDLVERASELEPAVLLAEVELEHAREVIAKCAPVMELRVEPRMPSLDPPPRPVSPSGPGGYRRPYRVRLVAITDRIAAIRMLHARFAQGLADARTLVDGVVAGQPLELAQHQDATSAAELAVSFGPVGMIQIEHT